MKRKFLHRLLFICLGLTACQMEQKIENKSFADPNKFGLGVSSMKSSDEIDLCLKENLSSNGIRLSQYIKGNYPKHQIIEYHLKNYQEILRLADRKGKRQVFFTYDPQKENDRVIFDIVTQCIN